MKSLFTKRITLRGQFLFSIILIVVVSSVCFGIAAILGYRVVALILLLTVSLIAISFDILPVLLSAIISSFIWNFFFIPPRFTFHIGNTEDGILFVMYFVIAVISAALTFKIRQAEKIARSREEKAKTLKLYETILHSLSHELRTPISTIIAATDNLQSNNSLLTTENKEQLITEISKASFRLNQHVENLLNISRLETGSVHPYKDWCDINDLVHSTVAKIEEDNVPQKINIQINPDLPLVRTDKFMLEQVLFNLVNNACVHTEKDTVINISAMIFTDILQIVVEDNGEGFPENEIENAFEIFNQFRPTNTPGTGLGLSIVKGFTEALDGHVILENVPTGGSRFTLHISCEMSYLKA